LNQMSVHSWDQSNVAGESPSLQCYREARGRQRMVGEEQTQLHSTLPWHRGCSCRGHVGNSQGMDQHEGWCGEICYGPPHQEVKQFLDSCRKPPHGKTRYSQGTFPPATASGRAPAWGTKSPLGVEPSGQHPQRGGGDAAPQAGHAGLWR